MSWDIQRKKDTVFALSISERESLNADNDNVDGLVKQERRLTSINVGIADTDKFITYDADVDRNSLVEYANKFADNDAQHDFTRFG